MVNQEPTRVTVNGKAKVGQTTEIHIRIALMNCFSALGTAEIVRVA